MNQREDQVRRFIAAVVDAAFSDASKDGRFIPEYDPRNSGERLVGRLNLGQYRVAPRTGDGKYARSIYTAARWLYDTEKESKP